MPTTEYQYDLDLDAAIRVSHRTDDRGALADYAVVLVTYEADRAHTVRVWDCHQGQPHMHRYTRSGGKEPGVPTGATTLQAGYADALDQARRGYREIVDTWRRS